MGRSKGGDGGDEYVTIITGGSIGTNSTILGGVDVGNSEPAD